MTTTTTTGRPFSNLSLRGQTDNYNGAKFFVALIFPVIAAYAVWMGWVKIPSASVFGGTLGVIGYLVIIALIFWGLNRESRAGRNVAGIALFVLGVITALNWSKWTNAFADFTASDVVGLVVGLIVLFVFAAWMARRD